MIFVKLNGGLGNQMFEYAMGRSLAIRNNTDLLLDARLYKENGLRQYSLDKFEVHARIATAAELSTIRLSKVGGFIDRLKNFGNRRYLSERKFSFDEKAFNSKKVQYIEGYFQSEKYFKPIENIIRKEFELRNVNKNKLNRVLLQIGNTDSVSLHIRRTDFLSDKNKKIYRPIPLDYYIEAINKFCGLSENVHLYLFSDDIQWAKNNLAIPPNVHSYFVSGNGFTDLEEFFLISRCKHNITANSTFSWWGAWLNENRQKIVITPEKWFVDPNIDESDLIPTEWLKL